MIEEEYLARKYCEPKAYWHCLQELGEPPMSFRVLNELEGAPFAVKNYPERWLDAVRICTKREPSRAAKQLHRNVEAARAEFKAKQDRIYGNRKFSETEGLEDIYRREDRAWDAFNAQKQVYLQDYLKAKETGKLVRRARTYRKCRQCKATKVIGRATYCATCAKQRHREAVRVNKKLSRSLRVISWDSQVPQSNGLAIAQNGKLSHLATPIPETSFSA
jgi:hypothetical protein